MLYRRFNFGYATDIGCDREKQEDFISFKEFDDGSIFYVVADGTGSRENYLQPATIASTEILSCVERLYNDAPEIFLNNPELFLKYYMQDSNTMLGAFKLANEEIFSGYAASVTCTLMTLDGRFYTAYAGNVRQYLIRQGRITQLTKDHTEGMELLDDGVMDFETYYTDRSRLQLTSGIGLVLDPKIDTYSGRLKETDVLLTATDGISYALRPEHICRITLEAGEPLSSCSSLIEAARDVVQYPDNMAVSVITGII